MMALATIVCANFTNASAQTGPEIRLVLEIPIDALRADLINRYKNGFGKGGFRFLIKKGTYYTNAHYQHANTETMVGHAALATGTLPSQHGMAEMPEYMIELGYRAGRLDPGEILAAGNRAGQKFGIGDIVRFSYRPYLYLNDEKIGDAKLDRRKVEHGIAVIILRTMLWTSKMNQKHTGLHLTRSIHFPYALISGR